MSTLTSPQEILHTGAWQADGAHSRVEFAVDYMTGTFRGSFSPFEARLEDGVLRGAANVPDVKVQDENLAAHLQSPEFFDAERTPRITFESSELTVGASRVTIAGELTIRGTSQPVELTGTVSGPITDPYGRERVGLLLEGSIDRTAFGLLWNNPLPTGAPALANDVRLTTELYLVRA